MAEGEEKAERRKKKKKRSSKRAAADEEEEGTREEPSLIDIAEGEEPSPSASLTAKAESPRKKSPVRDTKKQGQLEVATG